MQMFLPGVSEDLIRAVYLGAPGNEIESGKFASPESSAALVANAFGVFLDRPNELPPLPGTHDLHWPACSLTLEAIMRFPWSAGRHPCLDVSIVTGAGLIGVESKRYEPFRHKSAPTLSEAYWRPVWGDRMVGYESIRDGLRDQSLHFLKLDATQLVKHAFGLRTAVQREPRFHGKQPVLFYLFAQPAAWPDGRPIPLEEHETHRREIAVFANAVARDEVDFLSCSYRELLAEWTPSPNEAICRHALAVKAHFAV